MNNKFSIKTERIQDLSDGIFAFAMTLLMLNIDIPILAEEVAREQLPSQLFNLIPSFFNFAVSFILLGSLWYIHHKQFHVLKSTTEGITWVNMIMLLFVVLLPLTTELMEEYIYVSAAVLMFNVNLLILFLLYAWIWRQASKHKLMDEDFARDSYLAVKKTTIIIIVIAIAAIMLGLIFPQESVFVYLLIPLLVFVSGYQEKKKKLPVAS